MGRQRPAWRGERLTVSNNIYRGGMPCFGSLRAAAEARDPQPEVADMTAGQHPDAVRLDSETGQTGGFGSRPGEAVPNLSVTRLSTPAKTSGLPSNVSTDQSTFTAAAPRARR